MITSLKEALLTASKNLYKKTGLKWIVLKSKHFQDRYIERFSSEDLIYLERAIEKAAQKIKPNEKIKYTHPIFGITVVVKRVGFNGLELITCWKQGV